MFFFGKRGLLFFFYENELACHRCRQHHVQTVGQELVAAAGKDCAGVVKGDAVGLAVAETSGNHVDGCALVAGKGENSDNAF